jgi:uncharacterized RDD family membrane protein YckC
MDQRRWHFMREGREWGPVTAAELREMLEASELDWKTSVRSAETSSWTPAQDIPEIVHFHRIVLEDEVVLPAEPVSQTQDFLVFLWRFLAFLFDTALLIVVIVGLQILWNEIRYGWTYRPEEKLVPLFLFFGWFYYAGMESTVGGTLGKLIVGLTVTDLRGQRISFFRGSGRWFAKIISALPFYLGFAFALIQTRGRAVHDLIAGTLVIRRPITKEAGE